MSDQAVQAQAAGAGALVKEMLFKQDFTGISKKSGNQYRRITLHDPATLENMDSFVNDDVRIDTEGYKLRDKVVATFAMDYRYGRMEPVLVGLRKA